jgi:hypothetical protein
MNESFSDEFKKIFLLAFTKELIKHSQNKDISNLQRIIELEESKRKEKIPSAFHVEYTPAPKKLNAPAPEKKISPKIPVARIKPLTRRIIRPALIIPEPKLPSHLEYLRPVPTSGVEIDLLKINPLIKDPGVRVIEGNPDERVKVSGGMGTKPTSIVLSKEDIDAIIDKFSKASKIPAGEGIYRVVVGNLSLSAVISEMVGSRFVIRKMIAPREQPSSPPQVNNIMPMVKSSFPQRLQY